MKSLDGKIVDIPIKDREIVFISKNYFPLDSKSSEGLYTQTERIAREEGLKYSQILLERGMMGWSNNVVRPLIYREFFEKSNDKRCDFKSSFVYPIAYFPEDGYFIIRKGFPRLKDKLRDLCETYVMVREAEDEIKEHQKKLEEIHKKEQEQQEKSIKIIGEDLKGIIINELPQLVNKIRPEHEYSLEEFKNSAEFDEAFKMFKYWISSEFYRRVSEKIEYSNADYDEWKKEAERIIIPKRYRRLFE